MLAARASRNLGLDTHVTFSGALAWPYVYPWPQRPPGLSEEAFSELGKRWRPILDAFAQAGVDVAYEIHPGEDLFDGATFERFIDVRAKSDQEIADVLTYIRNSFGNAADPVPADEVSEVRAAIGARATK